MAMGGQAARLRHPHGHDEGPKTTGKEMAFAAAHAAERKILLCVFDELPSWLQDNHFIRTSYRHPSNSFLTSFHSLFYLHNESINIYTHLLGAIFSLLLLSLLILHPTPPPPSIPIPNIDFFLPHPTATQKDTLAFLPFLLGSVTCLTLSSVYHTISNHSPSIAAFGNRLDYLGIVAMIAGSYVTSLYYGFYCHNNLFITYTAFILLLGATCATLTLAPKFRTPEYRPTRAILYILYGCSGVVPIFHAAGLMGWGELNRAISLTWLLAQGGLYVLGAALYAARIPERWWPGKVDVIGSSHQVFHLLVLAAAATHGAGLVKAFEYRHGVAGGRC